VADYVQTVEFIPRIKSRELLLGYLASTTPHISLVALTRRWDFVYPDPVHPRVKNYAWTALFASSPVFETVPDVVGDPVAVANGILTGAGFNLGAQTSEYSEDVPAGNVISQNPVAGAIAGLGTLVFLVISVGAPPSPAEVPPTVAPFPPTFEIPLQVGQPQVFAISLGQTPYQLTFRYRNVTNGGWVLDIADTNGNAIISGIPLVTGTNLLAQYAYLDFGGALWVQTTSDPDAVPTFENLGGDALIWWVPDTLQ
jgi:hypothetical protein